MTKAACANCHFVLVKMPTKQLFCRRHPPTALVVGMQQNAVGKTIPLIDAVFPPMDPNSWCGEYAPAVAATELSKIDLSSLAALSQEGNA